MYIGLGIYKYKHSVKKIPLQFADLRQDAGNKEAVQQGHSGEGAHCRQASNEFIHIVFIHLLPWYNCQKHNLLLAVTIKVCNKCHSLYATCQKCRHCTFQEVFICVNWRYKLSYLFDSHMSLMYVYKPAPFIWYKCCLSNGLSCVSW